MNKDFVKKVNDLLSKYRQKISFSKEDITEMESCPGDDLLLSYLDNSLSFFKYLKVKRHIRKCSRCLLRTAELVREKTEFDCVIKVRCPEKLFRTVIDKIFLERKEAQEEKKFDLQDLIKRLQEKAREYLSNLESLLNQQVVAEHRMGLSIPAELVVPIFETSGYRHLGVERELSLFEKVKGKIKEIFESLKRYFGYIFPREEQYRYAYSYDRKICLKLMYDRRNGNLTISVVENKSNWLTGVVVIEYKDHTICSLKVEINLVGTTFRLQTNRSLRDIKKVWVFGLVERTVSSLLDRSKKYLIENQIDNCIRTVDEVLSIEPENYEALLLKSILYALQDKWGLAKSTLEQNFTYETLDDYGKQLYRIYTELQIQEENLKKYKGGSQL